MALTHARSTATRTRASATRSARAEAGSLPTLHVFPLRRQPQAARAGDPRAAAAGRDRAATWTTRTSSSRSATTTSRRRRRSARPRTARMPDLRAQVQHDRPDGGVSHVDVLARGRSARRGAARGRGGDRARASGSRSRSSCRRRTRTSGGSSTRWPSGPTSCPAHAAASRIRRVRVYPDPARAPGGRPAGRPAARRGPHRHPRARDQTAASVVIDPGEPTCPSTPEGGLDDAEGRLLPRRGSGNVLLLRTTPHLRADPARERYLRQRHLFALGTARRRLGVLFDALVLVTVISTNVIVGIVQEIGVSGTSTDRRCDAADCDRRAIR